MLFSDCYAVLALAARQTRRIRLGPGTAICGTHIPPVHVAGMATLNRLAPGRVHIGVGTGNTAMRTMGQRPMRVADYDEYLRVLAALLRGEVVDYRYDGRVRPVKMLMHETKYMSLEPKIPLYVSGFGPRTLSSGATGSTTLYRMAARGWAQPGFRQSAPSACSGALGGKEEMRWRSSVTAHTSR
jgi:alkanesulfonate monooxygenase SsuD/methylene tetrahydromethanopterin reductase-like flavin-dependent oxidoreductase (luciferase family)